MATITAPLRCKRPITAKKHLRRIGDDVFRTIVEMAYEMEKADKINNEMRAFEEVARQVFGWLKDERKKTGLRYIVSTLSTTIPRSYPTTFKCNGKYYAINGRIDYGRFRQINRVIKEVGHFYVFISRDGRPIHATMLTDSYDTDEKYVSVKEELQEIFIDSSKYILWS